MGAPWRVRCVVARIVVKETIVQILMGPPKPDWQVATICPGFVVEVNCNGGGYRRVFPDGRIEPV